MLLEKLALPKFEARIIDEINSSRSFYNKIDELNMMENDKLQYKKKIISNSVFDMFVGIFDLGYDLKLKFNKDNEDNNSICVDIRNNFDDIFYQVYLQCFYKYLSKIHLLKNNRIDADIYKLSRMATLNKDKDMIKKLADNAYLEFIEKTELESKVVSSEISQEEIEFLSMKERERVKNLINRVMELNWEERASYKEIRNVFACFSSSVFYKLNCKEKAHLGNLIYNYFSISGGSDNRNKYERLFNNDVTNKRCLEIVIEDLLVSGKSMIIRRKNMDIVNNVLSGLPYIYKNELDKDSLNLFDSLHKIVDKLKK